MFSDIPGSVTEPVIPRQRTFPISTQNFCVEMWNVLSRGKPGSVWRRGMFSVEESQVLCGDGECSLYRKTRFSITDLLWLLVFLYM